MYMITVLCCPPQEPHILARKYADRWLLRVHGRGLNQRALHAHEKVQRLLPFNLDLRPALSRTLALGTRGSGKATDAANAALATLGTRGSGSMGRTLSTRRSTGSGSLLSAMSSRFGPSSKRRQSGPAGGQGGGGGGSGGADPVLPITVPPTSPGGSTVPPGSGSASAAAAAAAARAGSGAGPILPITTPPTSPFADVPASPLFTRRSSGGGSALCSPRDAGSGGVVPAAAVTAGASTSPAGSGPILPQGPFEFRRLRWSASQPGQQQEEEEGGAGPAQP